MSHTRVVKLRIKQFSFDLGKQVLKQLQKVYGGTLEKNGERLVFDRYGFYEVKRDGELVYDDYSAPVKFYQFSNAFNNMYTALLIKGVAGQFGYSFNIVPKATEKGLQVLMGGQRL